MRSLSFRLAMLLGAVALAGGCALDTPVLQRGASESMGVLLNLSCGAHPCDAIDPCKPTIVLTHGWNPLPERIRCTFAPNSSAALRRRCGDSYNLLIWDWNGVHVPVFNDGPVRTGRQQGRMMAAALRARGVQPARTQIIAHSLGTVATAQAALCLADLGPFAQLTLLDPPRVMHEVIFDQLCATQHARCVENYWAPGTAGYGAPVHRAGVRNYRVYGPHPVVGTVDLSRSSHVYVMLWYYNTIRCPQMDFGFQTSAFVHCCGRAGQDETEGDAEPAPPAIETAAAPPTWDEIAVAPRTMVWQ
ncbi:MAG TPA: hypothetical protein VEQ85_16530 [Lacipirellulaceae bacterium]|nr:hypothetical protein [Lacipirellulaceae bacterium]